MTPWRAAGAALILCGLALGGGGALLFADARERASQQDSARAAVDAACKRQLGLLGAVSADGDRLALRVENVADPRTALGDATLALAFCPTRAIASFCLGSGCSGSGGDSLSMLLRLTAPAAR